MRPKSYHYCLIGFFIAASILAFDNPSLPSSPGMIYIKGGKFLMGSEDGRENEKPVHPAQVNDFFMDVNLVTYQQFDSFIIATGYKTDAEKSGAGFIYDFELNNWILVKGADWQHPFGPHGQPGVADYPVTQVSWQDAIAYCQWAGKRLPTEAEWEFAARQGVNSGDHYSWGNHLYIGKKYYANVWEGVFPVFNTSADGFSTTSIVGWFGKTKNGLNDMGGNVWEWCADSYKLYKSFSVADSSLRVCRGGSFLSDSLYAYTVSGRTYRSQETASYDIGFRCAKDVK